MKVLDEAMKFAVDAHSGMLRKKDNCPYILHPAEVAVIAGTMTREEFDAWTTEAKVMRMACLQEQITLDEFIAWLDKDKRRTMD